MLNCFIILGRDFLVCILYPLKLSHAWELHSMERNECKVAFVAFVLRVNNDYKTRQLLKVSPGLILV